MKVTKIRERKMRENLISAMNEMMKNYITKLLSITWRENIFTKKWKKNDGSYSVEDWSSLTGNEPKNLLF